MNDYKNFIENNKDKSYDELMEIYKIYKEIYDETYLFISFYMKFLLIANILNFIAILISFFIENFNQLIRLSLTGFSVACAILIVLIYNLLFMPILRRCLWISNKLIDKIKEFKKDE